MILESSFFASHSTCKHLRNILGSVFKLYSASGCSHRHHCSSGSSSCSRPRLLVYLLVILPKSHPAVPLLKAHCQLPSHSRLNSAVLTVSARALRTAGSSSPNPSLLPTFCSSLIWFTSSCLRAFAFAVPSARNTLLLDAYIAHLPLGHG